MRREETVRLTVGLYLSAGGVLLLAVVYLFASHRASPDGETLSLRGDPVPQAPERVVPQQHLTRESRRRPTERSPVDDPSPAPDARTAEQPRGEPSVQEYDSTALIAIGNSAGDAFSRKWFAELTRIREVGGTDQLLKAVIDWQARAGEAEARPAESALWYLRSVAEFLSDEREDAVASLVRGGLALRAEPGAMMLPIGHGRPWLMLTQMVPMAGHDLEFLNERMLAAGRESIFSALGYYHEAEREKESSYILWLDTVATKDPDASHRIAAALWLQLLQYAHGTPLAAVVSGPRATMPDERPTSVSFGPYYPHELARDDPRLTRFVAENRRYSDHGGVEDHTSIPYARWALREQVLLTPFSEPSAATMRLQETVRLLLDGVSAGDGGSDGADVHPNQPK